MVKKKQKPISIFFFLPSKRETTSSLPSQNAHVSWTITRKEIPRISVLLNKRNGAQLSCFNGFLDGLSGFPLSNSAGFASSSSLKD